MRRGSREWAIAWVSALLLSGCYWIHPAGTDADAGGPAEPHADGGQPFDASHDAAGARRVDAAIGIDARPPAHRDGGLDAALADAARARDAELAGDAAWDREDASSDAGSIRDAAADSGWRDGGLDASWPRPDASWLDASWFDAGGRDTAVLFDDPTALGEVVALPFVLPSEHTIELWLRLDAPIADGVHPLLTIADSAGSRVEIVLEKDRGRSPKLVCLYAPTSRPSSEARTSHSVSSLADGAWHHVGCTRDSGWHMAIGDGIAGGQSPPPPLNAPPAGARLALGVPMGGAVDDLRISSIDRYGSRYPIPPRPLTVDEHTLALFGFDEGVGPYAFDTGPHGLVMVLHRAGWTEH